ncbi:hypothetical protein FACS1894199_18460 [Bacteroidia bacterium]|nr:hypothetical protein FACS1894199_18460 [Bacteroidia bacterium]
MKGLDIIILILLLYGAYKGFKKGLVVEIATLVGMILGVYIALKFSGLTAQLLEGYLDFKYTGQLAFTLTFVAVVFGVYFLGRLVTTMVNMLALGLLNRILGLVFGAGKICIVICVLLLIINMFDTHFGFFSEETKNSSFFYQPFLNFALGIYGKFA